MDFFRSPTYNPPKLVTTQMGYIHTMEYNSTIKKEQTIDTHNLDGSQKHYAELKKKQDSKDYIQFDSIYVTSSKWQNYSDGAQISGFQRLGWEESVTSGSTKEFWGWWNCFALCGGGYTDLHMCQNPQNYILPPKSILLFDNSLKGNRSFHLMLICFPHLLTIHFYILHI